MTISFPLTFPTYTGLGAFSIRGPQVSGATTAPFSGVQQIQEHAGGWWEADFELPPTMSRAQAAQWSAWLQSLRGRVGTFLMGIPREGTPRGSAGVTPGGPQVDGAGQTGLTLTIKTSLGAVSGYLLAGDWISLGAGSSRRLHRLMADASLVGGAATLDIWPRLRSSPANNDTVYVSNATGRFRLTGAAADYSLGRYDQYTIPPISCREALE
jgi:hypothetical protein